MCLLLPGRVQIEIHLIGPGRLDLVVEAFNDLDLLFKGLISITSIFLLYNKLIFLDPIMLRLRSNFIYDWKL